MNNTIEIRKVEFEFLTFTRNLYEDSSIKVAMDVEFSIGEMEGKIKIPITEVSTIDEDKIKKYIYEYLNSNLERKFIDEF